MMKNFSLNSFVAGTIFGLLLAGAWLFRDGNMFMPASISFTPTTNLATSTESGPHGSGAISVANQSAGNSVTVESVTVPPPGVWVAVREVVGNELGNVLGAARVKGPQSNVTVFLLRATEPNDSYAIELYRDDGSETFDASANSVYVDFDTGERVVAYFTTTK